MVDFGAKQEKKLTVELPYWEAGEQIDSLHVRGDVEGEVFRLKERYHEAQILLLYIHKMEMLI